jgi:hypothetical protein
MGYATVWVLGGTSIVLFVLQGIWWALFRMRRVRVTTWQKLSAVWLVCSLIVMVTGMALVVGGDPLLRPGAAIGILGGLFNSLIVLLHRWTVQVLQKRIGAVAPKGEPPAGEG